MKTVLICHANEPVNAQLLPLWLASFSELAGIVVLEEKPGRMRERIRREWRRSGWWRFLDVLAFRLYYRLFHAKNDARWEHELITKQSRRFAPLAANIPRLHSDSPNSPEARAFIEKCQPDIMIARCKTLLKAEVFDIPATGTFVMHPGICPEYRNAHGCFWALAHDDLDNVGMTLLRVDSGVDTGPVYGYFRYDYDERTESHIVIQTRVVTDNLNAIAQRLQDIQEGNATPINTQGRPSGVWGQPWLSRYLGWKRRARRRAAS